MTSESDTAVQNYFCPVRQVHLTRQLRLAWVYFDPLGTFAPLAGLHRLISCPTTICSHNHYYRSQVLSAWQLGLAIFLRSLGLLRLAPVLCLQPVMAPCHIRWKKYGTSSAPHLQFFT